MNLREVTIGRSKNCDIYLDAKCIYASSIHASLYYDGNQLMYKDVSTNGTLINNVNIHKRVVPINRGDVIMIAGRYPLSWNQIDSFFPYTQQRQAVSHYTAQSPVEPTYDRQPNLSKWNWGAFFLPGIWGLFNGCWWLFILCFIPVPFLINVIAGVKGTEWAWTNKQWSSTMDFENTQSTWGKAGIIVFAIFVVLNFLCFYSTYRFIYRLI